MPILWTIELLSNLRIFLRTDWLRIVRQMESSFNVVELSQTLENYTTLVIMHPEFKNQIKIDIKSIPSEAWPQLVAKQHATALFWRRLSKGPT